MLCITMPCKRDATSCFLMNCRAKKAIRTWGCLDWLACCIPFAHTVVAWLKSSRIAPEVFPVQPPRDALAPLSATNRRRVTRLHEYLDENPDKIAKVFHGEDLPGIVCCDMIHHYCFFVCLISRGWI